MMSSKSLKFDGISKRKGVGSALNLSSIATSTSRNVDQKRKLAPKVKPLTKFALELRAPSWSANAYEDDAWFDAQSNPSRGRKERINFNILPERWRGFAKQWLCALDQMAEHGSQRSDSYGSAALYFTMMRRFLEGVELLGDNVTLSSLSEDHIQRFFLEYANSGVSSLTLHRMLTLMGRCYKWGPSGYGALDDGLAFDPSKDPFLLGKIKQAPGIQGTDSISESVAQELLSMAIDWVENKSDAVLFCLTAVKLYEQAKVSRGKTGSLTHVQCRKILAANPDIEKGIEQLRASFGIELRSLLKEGHHASVPGVDGVLADFMKMGQISKKMQQMFQGFVYIVCAGFNGWRASEIFSAQADGIRETPAGFLLASNVIKTAVNRDEPVSRPVPPIVASAVMNLAKVNQAMEGVFPRKGGKVGDGLFRSTTGGSIDMASLAEDINDAWAFFSGEPTNLKSHQFRKFFAHFFLRRFQGGADAVRWHFRHVSKEMIWAYAKDALGAKELVESKRELAEEIVRGVVLGNGYASASIAHELKVTHQTLKIGAKVLTVDEAASYISSEIEGRFSDVHPMEWGYCLFQNGDKGAACEAKSGPIEARSEPSTCGRCKFLCTGSENVPYWQQAAILHQEIVEHPKATKIMKVQSERFLVTASTILSRHDGMQGDVK